MADEAQDERIVRAKKRGRRIAALVFVSFAAAFVLLSLHQIIVGVFGVHAQPLSATPGTPGKTCADGVRSLAAALDRGMAAATRAGTEADAMRLFRDGLAPEWSREREVAAACSADSHGPDAFAALTRLRLAEEGFLRRQVVEIAPVRRGVEAYLPR